MRSFLKNFQFIRNGLVQGKQPLRQRRRVVRWSRVGEERGVVLRRRYLSSSTGGLHVGIDATGYDKKPDGLEEHADVGFEVPVETKTFSFSALLFARKKKGFKMIEELKPVIESYCKERPALDAKEHTIMLKSMIIAKTPWETVVSQTDRINFNMFVKLV